MYLEGDDVRSLLHAGSRQNDVELGEDGGVVDLNGLGLRIELISQVEASHAVTVEVDSHTSSVLHTHVQHLIVINATQLEGLADVRGHERGVGNISGLARRPSGVIETGRVPVIGSSTFLIHLPIGEANLEGIEGGEGGGNTARVAPSTSEQLLNLEFHLTHIRRQRISSTS